MEPPRQAGVGPRIQYAQTKDGVNSEDPVRLFAVRWREEGAAR